MKKIIINHKISTILIILLLAVILITLINPPYTYNSYTYKIEDKDVLDPIKNKTELKQEFVSNGNYSKFGMLMATYGEYIKKGKIVVSITDEENNVKKFEIKAKNLTDNQYYFLNYKLKKGKKYIINIKTEKLNKPITIYTTSATIKNSSLSVNGEDIASNLIMSFLYKKNDYFNIWYCILAISIILVYVILDNEIYIKKEKKNDKKRL